MSTNKRRTLFKVFVVSQFNHCHLVWMLHTKELNNQINNQNGKALPLNNKLLQLLVEKRQFFNQKSNE